jgi:hypothetical protein
MTAVVPIVATNFTHLRSEFTDRELCRYGSPHVSKKEVGEELFPELRSRGSRPVCELDCGFQRKQIICANDVFPEAVSADPLADLEIWDEWQQNIRRFPFPGLFSPLGIAGQTGKTTSSTSVGVLGEIMCGLFSQAYISPWVIVRPIRRWPDFIFFCSDDRYAFVESKAFTGTSEGSSDPWARVPRPIMYDCINHAVHQLNADPFVTVWFSFTEISRIDPLELRVTFLELNAPEHRHADRSRRVVPQAVVQGLAERAVSTGAAKVIQKEGFFPGDNFGARTAKGRTQKEIEVFSVEEVAKVMADSVPEALHESAKEEIQKQARKIAAKAIPGSSDPGRRMTAAKELASEGQCGELRSLGSERLYLVDLTAEQRRLLEREWSPNWEQATQKWKTILGTDFWRCSSAAVGLGPPGLNGERA